MISIIVPAHNEENVIVRCLEHLVRGAREHELEVIVVCNGCTDGTVAIAKTVVGPIKVVETAVASKTKALNLGEQIAQSYPRIFVDADVILDLDAIRKVADECSEGRAVVAAPSLHVNLQGASWFVRSFYDIWTRLPYVKEGLIGAGVYAVSRLGRSKFPEFPDVIADDEYVRRMFAAEDRVCLTTCSFTIYAPRRISSLIKIKTRSRLGRMQLADQFPVLASTPDKAKLGSITRFIWRPLLWPSVVTYVYVNAIVWYSAKHRWRTGNWRNWDRDDSSRLDIQD